MKRMKQSKKTRKRKREAKNECVEDKIIEKKKLKCCSQEFYEV